MSQKSPYDVIKSRYVTEKATVLAGLEHATSHPSLVRCMKPKVVFLVDQRANKIEIARAVEAIYANSKLKVMKVNTICVKPKKRRVRGRSGFRSAMKKAIVTLAKGDVIDEAI